MSNISTRLWLASLALRTIFLLTLLIAIVRVSMPQSETIWTAYDTIGDLIRVILGFFACVWVVLQLFVVPKDAHAHRTWIYLGLAVVPFVLICIIGTW